MNENFLMPIPQEDLAKRENMREFTTRGKEILKADYLKIKTRPGFNERDDWGDIEGLAGSMLVKGQLMPATVEMLKDGTMYLIDGERRYRAIGWLRGQGHEGWDTIDVIIAPKGLTDKDRLLMMVNLNNGGKRHTELEEGRIYRRLINLGMSAALIAKSVGVSEMIVSNRLRVDSLSDEEKNSISAGEISYTAALALAKAEADPKRRQEIIAQKADDGPLRVKEVLAQTEKKKKGLDSIPSSTPRDPKPENTDKYAPEESSRAKTLIAECLLMLKAIDNETEPFSPIGEYTLKIENNLRVLKGIVS